MTIQEIETRTGLSRANIRFYEQEGLLCPTRRPNGYREYSEQDLKMLLRIRLLRAIGLPIEQIRRLQDGTLRLEDALNDRCKWLHEQARSSAVAESLCNKLLQAGVSFDALDPTEYLVDLDADRPDLPVEDAAALRRLSLRRYFARMLDFGIYGLIWFALCALLFTRNLSTSPGGLVLLLDSAAGFALLFLFEPLLLHLFGSTPGKAALGLYVESSCGAKPGYWEALDRTGLVFFPRIRIRRSPLRPVEALEMLSGALRRRSARLGTGGPPEMLPAFQALVSPAGLSAMLAACLCAARRDDLRAVASASPRPAHG